MRKLRLPWPGPALLAWSGSWALMWALRGVNVSPWMAVTASVTASAVCSVFGQTMWRRGWIALGFPLSLVTCGAAGALPGWAWLLPLGVLLGLYPLNAWRDAPVFPTPEGALAGLGVEVPLHDMARVLDAGCGLGDGLRELRREYPRVRLDGLEWSWLLRLVCGWRCRYAKVRRGDMWATDWRDYELVYLFQRPESMGRAAVKAREQLRPGAWLASLEFPIPDLVATQQLACRDGRIVWLYQMPVATPLARSHRRVASAPSPSAPLAV